MTRDSKSYGGERDDETWRELRERVLKRDGYECQFCGIGNEQHRDERGQGLEAHHLVPKSEGGHDRADNLVTVCVDCHSTMEEFHARAVSQLTDSQTPAEEVTSAIEGAEIRYVEQMNREMRRYHEENPTFREEWGSISDFWGLNSGRAEHLTHPAGGRISERQFWVFQGFLLGVQAARNDISEALSEKGIADRAVNGFPERRKRGAGERRDGDQGHSPDAEVND